MNNMLRRCLPLTCLLLACGRSGEAQQPPLRVAPPPPLLINDVDQAKVATHPVTPFLEPTTLAVLDLDLAKLDLAATAKWVATAIGSPPDDPTITATMTAASGFVSPLRGAGVEHVYLTGATRSVFDRAPLLIVPSDQPEAITGLLKMLTDGARVGVPTQVINSNGTLLAGADHAVVRVQDQADVTLRPELVLPLEDTDRLDHLLVVSLPQEAREELIATWPDQLQTDFPVDISPRQLVADVERATLGWNLPPDPELRLTIETTDLAAATRVRTLAEQLLPLWPQAQRFFTVSHGGSTVVIESQPEFALETFAGVLSDARRETESLLLANSMKRVGVAMHDYHSAYKHFPPRCFVDKSGQPLLSGRVAVLPFLDQLALYEQFELGERFDSEHNLPISQTNLPLYRAAEDNKLGPGQTRIRLPVLPGSLWAGDGLPKAFRDIKDGTSYTILAIHAPLDAATNWASPEPWQLNEDRLIEQVFGDRDEVLVMFADGSVRSLQRDQLDREKLKALLTIAGGERIESLGQE